MTTHNFLKSVDVSKWLEWAQENRVHCDIQAFVGKYGLRGVSPRQWVALSEVLKTSAHNASVKAQLTTSLLGRQTAIEFNNEKRGYQVSNMATHNFLKSVDVSKWLEWAQENRVHCDIQEFVRKYGLRGVSPRQWFALSEVLKTSAHNASVKAQLTTSLLGRQIAIEFNDEKRG